MVLGQPNPKTSNALGIGSKGLVFPWSVAVDPVTGDLYVADFGDNRVLRFPKPFANPTRVEPDAVYGQPDFTTLTANSTGVTAHTMRGPRGVAFDGHGNLWVADTGNHRLLRFPAGVLNNSHPAADLVLGQIDFQSANPDRGGAVSATGFDGPFALCFDAQNNLYVSDYANTRILKFVAPVISGSAATVVFGQTNFTSRGVPQVPTSSSLAGPTAVAVDPSGKLYVAVPYDNRVLVFASAGASGAAATAVIGQPDFTTNTANTGAFPEASAISLAGAAGLAVDSHSSLYVADSGNNRLLAFAASSRSASHILGQNNFSANAPNQVKSGSIRAPYKIAVDYSHTPFALYVSDTNNHRVLVWKDAAHFHTGDPADLVIGQPNLTTAAPNADSGGNNKPSSTTLFAPHGIAVAADGTLFVADTGNNRVLRYPRPVDQSGRITPDAVLGQSDFVSSTSADVSSATQNTPTGIAIGPNGNVFVADSRNNRVLEYKNGAGTGSTALRVYGQATFDSSAAPTATSAVTLSLPQGLWVDAAYNLYVADTGANRVLIFPNTSTAPPAGLPASLVIGQGTFDAASPGGGTTGLNAPVDVALDSGENIFVSDNGNNRVVVFPSLLPGGPAYLAIGQRDVNSNGANWNTPDGLATAEGLSGPLGIFVDRKDTLYVGDSGNNRVVHFLKPVTSIVNGATLQPSVPVGRGAWTALLASGLSTKTQHATTTNLPTALAGRELVINDSLKAPLRDFSPTQVNFVFPSAVSLGLQRVGVRTADTGELLFGGTVSVAAYSPGFFASSSGQATAKNQDNTVNGPSHPAARGTVIQLFGTGQGPVATPVPDGQPAPAGDTTLAVPTSDAATCLNRQPAVCVALGGSGGGAQLAEIQYSGLAAGQVGVWQLNIKIPTDGLLGNSISIRTLIGGANQSNLVNISVK